MKPIIFSGPMVRAILDGRKTQTRRVVKPTAKGCTVGVYSDSQRGPYECVNVGDDGDPIDSEPIRCPYGVPGDRLWVRESGWIYRSSELTMFAYDDGSTRCLIDGGKTHDEPPKIVGGKPWRASDYPIWSDLSWILMPRWASRLTLVVEAVRVERLSAITHEDAIAEGFQGHDWVASSPYINGPHTDAGELPAEEYVRVFRAMHKFAPDADPWVWVVTFRRDNR